MQTTMCTRYWKNYFDLVITKSRGTQFFTQEKPFLVDSDVNVNNSEHMQHEMTEGNMKSLTEYFEHKNNDEKVNIAFLNGGTNLNDVVF